MSLLVFLDLGLKFQSSFYNGCHDALVMSVDINSIVVLDIHYVDYCCIIIGITKSEAIDLMKNTAVSKKSGSLYNM